MKQYSKFQFGWLLPLILIPLIIFFAFAYTNQWGNNPMNLEIFVVSLIILISCILLFYGMKVSITQTHIRISFGIGLIRKKIVLESIKSVEAVRNPWYYGLGIKIIPKGMLYNISGRNAVELTFKNSKNIIRIGAANSEELKNAIENSINNIL